MNDRIRVREARPADASAILEFDEVAFVEPERAAFVVQALESKECLVADCDGRVVGYVVLEYTFYERGFVSMLYVAAAERRSGVGRSLLEAVASRCSTAQLFTSTNQSNRPMQELLASLGYVASGVIENLDPGDPELVYCLRLRPPEGM